MPRKIVAHMAGVKLESVSKVFRGPKREEIHAVRDLNLQIADREFMVIVGPSGCGKTTTLRLVAGLEPITRGEILIDGQVVNQVEPGDRDLAMVFQNDALFPHLTVLDNMALGLRARHLSRKERHHRVQEAAKLLDLAAHLHRLPSTLSGGQRQRVAIGRAIVCRPKVFLLDEPLSNLDARMRVRMRLEIHELQRRLKATMIYVTHDQVEAMALGDRVAVMDAGIIQQTADPGTLYQAPANLFVAGFIGAPPMNLIKGRLNTHAGKSSFRGDATAPDGTDPLELPLEPSTVERLQSWTARDVVLGLRAERIHLVPSRPGQEVAAPFSARVELVEPTGPDCLVHLSLCGWRFVARVPADRSPASHATVQVRFDTAYARFFDPATTQAIA